MAKSAKISVLLVDDHLLMRMGLKSLLSIQKDIAVVGEAENGEQAVALASSLHPDVVIMDLMMNGMNGATATKLICREQPDCRVLVLTSYGNSVDIARALSYGAKGVQLKGSSTDDLLAAIRAVAAGKTAIAAEVKALLADLPDASKFTDRQLKILSAVGRGFNTDDIAKMLGVSVRSVKQDIALVCELLGAANRSEAAVIAVSRHII